MGLRKALAALLLLTPCLGIVSFSSGGLQPSKLALLSRTVQMGRAERRAAAKRAKKGPISSRVTAAPKDVMSRDAVLTKMKEVPVFGLVADVTEDGQPSYLTAEDGCSSFYMDAREAQQASAQLGRGLRVNGVTLDQVYFDPSVRLKPSDESINQARLMMNKGVEPSVNVPLFAIDGMQTTDKTTGIESTPLFFSRSELLDFGKTCMQDPERHVLLTDLSVVVDNMLKGPAGLLRNCKLFPTAASLVALDEQASNQRQALFPGQSGAPDPKVPDVMKGLFGKWS